jgi:hypothetical protein
VPDFDVFLVALCIECPWPEDVIVRDLSEALPWRFSKKITTDEKIMVDRDVKKILQDCHVSPRNKGSMKAKSLQN